MFIEAILLGIIEGITEWLPISSTGHLILADEFIKLNQTPEFMSMFNVVIQLGAIMAVVVLYFNKLNPFSPSKPCWDHPAFQLFRLRLQFLFWYCMLKEA